MRQRCRFNGNGSGSHQGSKNKGKSVALLTVETADRFPCVCSLHTIDIWKNQEISSKYFYFWMRSKN